MSNGELVIQTALQAAFQAMPEFADADVVINDWGVLDQAIENAPYLIISNADNFKSRQDAKTPETTWEEAATLYEPFTDWKATSDNLRTRRQAVIDKINSDDVRSAGGLSGITLDEIKNEGPILPYYDPHLTAEQIPEADPIYLYQTWLLTCEEF